jgi:hypothetical protein
VTPEQFKRRYVAALPEPPPHLNLDLGEFATFSRGSVDALHIDPTDRRLLSDIGLPRRAAPFLSFGARAFRALPKLSGYCGGDTAYDRYRIIGSTGSGDSICIDTDTGGSVVYLNHDANMKRVFMNSNVSLLAESLCLYRENRKIKPHETFLGLLLAIDAPAAARDAFWFTGN